MNNQQPTPDVISFPHSGGDPLDNAGRAAFEAIRRAADSAEKTTQHALSLAHKTTLQLRAAEERIAQLEAEVHEASSRAQRAEQWLHKIVAEIEHRFSAGSENRGQRQRPTGPDIYAPKQRMNEGLEAQMGDLLQSRSANSA